MPRREYLKLLMNQPADWIAVSLAAPSASMRSIHIALHKIALRRKGRFIAA